MTGIKIFGNDFYAVSNLFVIDCYGAEHVFPAPYGIEVTIGEEGKDSFLCLSVASYLDSPLILDYLISIFIYVLHYDDTLESYYFDSITLKETKPESTGYTAVYTFSTDLTHRNKTKVTNEQYSKIREQTWNEDSNRNS